MKLRHNCAFELDLRNFLKLNNTSAVIGKENFYKTLKISTIMSFTAYKIHKV
jgi:hypothetical protein